MAELADLFPGFASEWIATSRGRIFARIGGDGPPLLLLHGYPQTHVMWHRVVPQMVGRFRLVIADLPGYGSSDVPETDAQHTPFTKRAMAQTMIEVMEHLGYGQFALAGHDRGARVAYRLALDHPGRLNAAGCTRHPADLRLLGEDGPAVRAAHISLGVSRPALSLARASDSSSDPDEYLQSVPSQLGESWHLTRSIPRAPGAHYLTALRDPFRIHAACEDYRAGAHADFDHDQTDFDAGSKIT